jgi:hypothetical protein
VSHTLPDPVPVPVPIVLPSEEPAAGVQLALAGSRRPLAKGAAALAKVAQQTTFAAYARAKKPFPGKRLPVNAGVWRDLVAFAQGVVETASAFRTYRVEDVLVGTISAAVAKHSTKPVGYWLACTGEIWEDIKNQVPHERRVPRVVVDGRASA